MSAASNNLYHPPSTVAGGKAGIVASGEAGIVDDGW